MKKKVLSLFLCLLMIVSVVPMGTISASAVYSVSRDDGVWLFPLPQSYYSQFIDWAVCPFCGTTHSQWADSDHTGNPAGHNGFDISAPEGTNVYAPATGVVLGAAWRDARGYVVMVKHDLNNGWAYYSYSQHLSSMNVSAGQAVSAGTIIGAVGGSGGYSPHLHFGILMAPSNYSFDQVLSVDWNGGSTWLKNSGFATGRIIVNPKNGYGYAGLCNAGAAVDYHRGSVTYTFDKNAVRLPNANVPTTGISLNATQFTMGVGESKTITATVSPSNATNKNVTWTSSNTSVATVSSSGVVKAVGAGGAVITAKTASGGFTGMAEIVVSKEVDRPLCSVIYNGHYYEIYSERLTWEQAKSFCEKKGGHLATITSEGENNAIQKMISSVSSGISGYTGFFIGMTDSGKTQGDYQWITSESNTYKNWETGEPNNTMWSAGHERYQDYVLIASNGKWSDVNNYENCRHSVGFIYEYDKPQDYDCVTVIDGKVYELYDREYTISSANELAKTKGGYLLSLTSAEEQTAVGNWVKANSKAPYIALGATDAETEGTWKWTSGEKWGYTSWLDGEPNNSQGIEDNAIWFVNTNLWNDTAANKTSAFVIEYTLDEWLKQGNSLSDIILDKLPDGADPNDYEIVTEYRSRDKSTTTSTAASMDGWKKYDSKTAYGTWSSVKSTSTKPTASDTLQITGTWTQYHYYHYLNYYSGCYNIDSISYGTNKGKHDIYINYALSAVSMADQGGKQAYGYYSCPDESPSFNIWFYAGSTLFYNYQTRTKTTTNYFCKWSDWSEWGKTPIASTDTREVETRTVYRLKENATNPATVSSIAVQSKPSKAVYTVGETFNSSGLSIKVNMSDGTSKTITTGFTVSSPDMSTAGTKTVTVTYQGKTTTFTITVNPVSTNNPSIKIDAGKAVCGQQVKVPVIVEKTDLGTLTIDITYDSAKLQIASIGEIPFDMYDTNTKTAGKIRITATGNSSVPAGKVAVLTFDVIAQSACTADISIAVDEAYDANDNAVNLTVFNGTLEILKAVPGDINGDGKVSAIDARIALQYNAGNKELTAEQLAAADVNGDGKVSAIDARWILQAVAGNREI